MPPRRAEGAEGSAPSRALSESTNRLALSILIASRRPTFSWAGSKVDVDAEAPLAAQ
jgi:hypothetical protein